MEGHSAVEWYLPLLNMKSWMSQILLFYPNSNVRFQTICDENILRVQNIHVSKTNLYDAYDVAFLSNWTELMSLKVTVKLCVWMFECENLYKMVTLLPQCPSYLMYNTDHKVCCKWHSAVSSHFLLCNCLF